MLNLPTKINIPRLGSAPHINSPGLKHSASNSPAMNSPRLDSPRLDSPRLSMHVDRKQALIEEALSLRKNSSHTRFDDREGGANNKIKDMTVELKEKLPTEFYSNPMKFKEVIESSDLYKTIKKAPKGSQHHVHFDSILPSSWVKFLILNNLIINKKFVEYMRTNADIFKYDEEKEGIFFYKV